MGPSLPFLGPFFQNSSLLTFSPFAPGGPTTACGERHVSSLATLLSIPALPSQMIGENWGSGVSRRQEADRKGHLSRGPHRPRFSFRSNRARRTWQPLEKSIVRNSVSLSPRSHCPSCYPASWAQDPTTGPPPAPPKYIPVHQDLPCLHPFHWYHHDLGVLASLSPPEKMKLSQDPA